MNKEKFPFPIHGKCQSASIVAGEKYRFTVLTDCLLRLEYSPDSEFEDRPTLLATNRDFPVPYYRVFERKKGIELHTHCLSLYYDGEVFSPGGLSIKVRSRTSGIYSTWHYKDDLNENLKGTVRTLDQVDGETELEPGINSRLQGFSVLEDDTPIICDDVSLSPRVKKGVDLYFFGYGLEYQRCLNDFFKLSGNTPLLPRWVLGNWWSRFYPYSERSYNELIERFKKEEIPLSVAVLDMDWHITDVKPEEGKGWSGFTWNTELFPDSKRFLENMHRYNLKVSMNLHPAEGIQPHEKYYSSACHNLGRDEKLRYSIPMDFTDPDFVRTYFEIMLYPLEREGVDLWWIDWQQGNKDRFPGADPLWFLNHYHFLDQAKDGNRGVTFSRYAGAGGHKYPIGFSGDTIISWNSLKFQPYFTATAANIGYGWWSHDIGGHCSGVRDEELFVRWVQLGVFSPIMRLHSTSNLFNGKEPWKYGQRAEKILKELLILRHQLIPYLYTMNWKCHFDNLILVRPMYFAYPDESDAYEMPNQYLFGSELIVSPITDPEESQIGLGSVDVWLPETQNYYDIFTGIRYRGGRKLRIYRPMEQIPVFARAGSILPLTDRNEAKKNGTNLPTEIELHIFVGANGSFSLFEDSGEGEGYTKNEYLETKFQFLWREEEKSVLKINSDVCCIFQNLPTKRKYKLVLIGAELPEAVFVNNNLLPLNQVYKNEESKIIIELPETAIDQELIVDFPGGLQMAANPVQKIVYERLNAMKIGYELKEKIYKMFCRQQSIGYMISELMTLDISESVISSLLEVVLAEG